MCVGLMCVTWETKGWTLCKDLVSAPALCGPEFLFSSTLHVALTPFLCSLLCSPFFLHRAQVHPLGLQFLSCAFPTSVLTGSYVDMLCWSQRPMKLSR